MLNIIWWTSLFILGFTIWHLIKTETEEDEEGGNNEE